MWLPAAAKSQNPPKKVIFFRPSVVHEKGTKRQEKAYIKVWEIVIAVSGRLQVLTLSNCRSNPKDGENPTIFRKKEALI